jgi:diacylglycerol kinase (ATP)
METSARVLIIFNAAAARARRAWPSVRETLERAGVRFDVCEPGERDETEARAREALREGYSTVAVVGGDGTLSAAASGFFESCDDTRPDELPAPINPKASLAILPAGTGDDFARGLTGGRREPLSSWAARLVTHTRAQADGSAETTRPVDILYGSVDAGARRFLCLNAATLGIGAEVASRVARQGPRIRRLPGEARFALAALAALAAWRDRRVRVRVDGGEWRECLTNIMAVANGTYAGGGMNLSPEAKLDDGRLDVLTACGLTTPQILRELTRIHRGGHVRNPKIHIERGTHVLIETIEGDALGLEADGDVRGHTPVEFRVMPAALRVVW